MPIPANPNGAEGVFHDTLDGERITVAQAPGGVQSVLTVNIPSDFASLQDAVDELSTRPVRQGKNIILNIERGHAPARGLRLDDGDFGRFVIRSDDAEVTVDPSFAGQLFVGFNCRMPVLDALFNMNHLGTDGYVLTHGGIGTIEPGAGVRNAGEHGCEVRASVLYAAATVWTGAGYTAIRLTNCAHATFQSADASNSNHKDDPSSNGWGRSIYCSRGSVLNFMGGTCTGSGGDGLVARRSLVAAGQSSITGSGNVGVLADQGGHIALQAAIVTGSANEDLRVSDGGVISALNATYGTRSQVENILTGAGIIFHSGEDALSYHKQNILGTVTQSGGVPTGAIIERNSNANGQYTRYADGTQVCWIEGVTLAHVNDELIGYDWTFPAAFSAAPIAHSCTVGGANNFTDIGAREVGASRHAGTGLTGRTIGVTRISGAPVNATATIANSTIMAIGRWY